MNKKELDTLIKKIEEKFRQIGVYDEVKDFLESDGVEQIICETINKLLVYMEEMEKNAPDESVKELANILRNAVAQNSHVIK